ncbi:MAG: diaminopimelate decarboxylase [Clostridiales Family XIII bacterium]|jgi:diaminopimelate decarboxylase|nr:diaminopimelate decarboxylase [Clostridiales Family XIII bacterium]
MMKHTQNKPLPVPQARLEEIAAAYGTPYYLYDEAAIRNNAKTLNGAFANAGFDGFIEHFAVKALPNPFILKVLDEEGIGADCSSLPELLLCERAGVTGEKIMFTSNQTPDADFEKALALGAVINLDDITHIAVLEALGGRKLPEVLSFRYNPGPDRVGNSIIGNPEEAKYGLTRAQLFEAYDIARSKGVKRFGLHTMVASNELNIEYHFDTARMVFTLAAEIHERLGIALEFVNLGGGVGIPYKPEDVAIDWGALASGIRAIYDEILGQTDVSPAVHTEYGRPITGPYGWLVARAIREKHIYRDYIGLDASMADLMRPGLYGAYHHITVPGKEDAPLDSVYDVVGGLCENNDKFAIRRALPRIDVGDLVVIHEGGAHAHAMGFNYNGKLRPQELLLRPDGSVLRIRRRETPDDYFATLDFDALADFS